MATTNATKRPDRTTMEGMIWNADKVLKKAMAPTNKRIESIPKHFFQDCEGVVLLNVIEAGFLFSGNVGTGVVMAHNKQDGTWSAPAAVGLTGVGWGFIAGASLKDLVIFIMDKDTMDTFSGNVRVMLGGQAALTLGKVGREVAMSLHASDKGVGATVTFSYAKGVFAGISVEGAVLAPRSACNMYFYGRDVTPNEILFEGAVTVPSDKGVEELHQKLQMLALNENQEEPSAVQDETIPNEAKQPPTVEGTDEAEYVLDTKEFHK